MCTHIIKKTLVILVLATVLLSSVGLAEGSGGGAGRMPFDGEILTQELEKSGGNCSLLLHHYEFIEGRYFSAWVFPRMSDSALERLVTANEARSFTCETRNVGDVKVIVFTQSGDSALQALILPDFNGYFMLLIEEYLETASLPKMIPARYPPVTAEETQTEQKPVEPPRTLPGITGTCTYCGGTNTCDHCINGECEHCFGEGSTWCDYCFGSGDCQSCYGFGGEDVYKVGKGVVWVRCSRCSGSGNCKRCTNGQVKCNYCNGSGRCAYCKGTGDCPYCHGR